MSFAGPAATDEVRRRNTALVLRLLRDSDGLSRADLARRSGLAKATVGTIVAQLHGAGAVAEGDAATSGRGRPSTPVVLSGHTMAGLGIELNVDYVAVTAVDLAGRELFAEEHAIAGGAPTPGKLVALADGHLGELKRRGVEVLGLTVAVPGLIDRSRGVVVDAPNLGWSDVALADTLGAALGGEVGVAVDNDANCAARAESLHGVAVGVRDFVYLTGTVGLGAGIVAGGEVFRGARGLAGEVGHLRVGDETHACACGRTGCWEALVGLTPWRRTRASRSIRARTRWPTPNGCVGPRAPRTPSAPSGTRSLAGSPCSPPPWTRRWSCSAARSCRSARCWCPPSSVPSPPPSPAPAPPSPSASSA